MQETHLSHKHTHTLQQIFQHPASHNLAWHDVVVFIKESGTVQEESGRLTFTLNGVSEVFHHSHGKEVADVQQVAELQHFLEKAGIKKDGTIALPEPAAELERLPEQEQHSHDRGHVNAEQNHDAEQQLKTQQHKQDERSDFSGGNAQAHQQGNRQK